MNEDKGCFTHPKSTHYRFKYTGKIVASAVGMVRSMVHKQARNLDTMLHKNEVSPMAAV